MAASNYIATSSPSATDPPNITVTPPGLRSNNDSLETDALALLSFKRFAEEQQNRSNNNKIEDDDENQRPTTTMTSIEDEMTTTPSAGGPEGGDPNAITASATPSGKQQRLKVPIAKLQGKDFEYMVRQHRLVIGRNSSTGGEVDINMGVSSFISRKHIEIYYENDQFYLTCGGKNGVFVDGVFQRKGAPPLNLAKK